MLPVRVPHPPSRPAPHAPPLGYRLKRLWRRRSVRRAVTVQAPALLLALAAWIMGSDPALHAAVTRQAVAVREALTMRPEFAIREVVVEGASPTVEAEIRAALIDVTGASSLALDPAALRRRIERLGWVARVTVSLEAPGTLRLRVAEREPAAVWRIDGEPWLIAADGAKISALFARDEYPTLPLIAGEGAEKEVAEALAIVAAMGPLQPRLRGLVRVGQRRWDVVLDRDQVIRLPMAGGGLTRRAAADPVAAMQQAAALHETEDLMERDIEILDLRVPGRPTLRLHERAIEAVGRARSLRLAGGRDA